MTTTVGREQWLTLTGSVRRFGQQFADMVAASPDTSARATRHWSVVETAAHVATVVMFNGMAVNPRDTKLSIPGLAELLPTATVDAISGLNEVMLAHFTERDPAALAGIVKTEVDRLVDACESYGPEAVVDWVGQSRVPVPGLLAHTLNELTIHGRDIARATRSPWQIPPSDAATFLSVFLVGMIREGYGHLLDTPQSDRPQGSIAVEFRSPYTGSVTLVLADGMVTVHDTPDRVDVRVTFKPAALNLMMFGRISKLRTILTGGVVVGGRRPWRLPTFLRTVRVPS